MQIDIVKHLRAVFSYASERRIKETIKKNNVWGEDSYQLFEPKREADNNWRMKAKIEINVLSLILKFLFFYGMTNYLIGSILTESEIPC